MGQKKVIIDTNVLISALGWGGKAYQVVDLAFSGSFCWLISRDIFEELVKVLEYAKLDFITGQEKEDFISAVSQTARFMEIADKETLSFADPDDIMFLRCAVETEADYLISGDKKLLGLGAVGRTKIVSPAQFLTVFKMNK